MATIIKAQAISEAEKIKGTSVASATSKDYNFYELLGTIESYKSIITNSIVVVGENLNILEQMK